MLMGALLALNTGVGFADDYRVLASDPVRVMVDGELVSSFDKEQNVELPAVIVNGRTMMPLRQTFGLFGVETTWNPNEASITAQTPTGGTIWLQINNKEAKMNGKTVMLDAAPTIFESRTFVPLAFVSEAMGVKPEWDGVNRIVMMSLQGLRGLALPSTIKSQYLDTYEEDVKTNFYYHRSELYKSIIVIEESVDKIEAAIQIADDVNVSLDEFVQVAIKESLVLSYKDSREINIHRVVFEKQGIVYSVELKDFSYDEAMNIVKNL